MDILWSSVYGIKWEQLETNDIEEARKHILGKFAENTPDTVMTQSAMVVVGRETEDARCILSVVFVHWYDYKCVVNVTSTRVEDGSTYVDVQQLVIDNSDLRGEIRVIDGRID